MSIKFPWYEFGIQCIAATSLAAEAPCGMY
jgi:hypothetical protein